MRAYRVILEGRPVVLADADTKKLLRLGFFTTRWVLAHSIEDAETKARELVLREITDMQAKNSTDKLTTVKVDEIEEVGWMEHFRRSPGRGFTFFPDEPN